MSDTKVITRICLKREVSHEVRRDELPVCPQCVDGLKAQLEALRDVLRSRPPKPSIPDDRYWRWSERVYEVTGE